MFFQTNTDFLDTTHIITLLIVICSFLIIAILFSFKLKDKPRSAKNYIIGIILFMILYAISRTCELSKIIIGLDDPYDTTLTIRTVLYLMSAIFGTVAVFILLVVLERYILEKKTKFIFSILTISFLILALIFNPSGGPVNLGKFFLYLSSIPALSIPLIYFYFGYKTTGVTRKRAIEAGIGFLIAFLGIIMDSAIGTSLFSILLGNINYGLLVAYILFAICVPIGLIIYYRAIHY